VVRVGQRRTPRVPTRAQSSDEPHRSWRMSRMSLGFAQFAPGRSARPGRLAEGDCVRRKRIASVGHRGERDWSAPGFEDT
jgi:hypothetical protein